jgi:hypothetical protein
MILKTIWSCFQSSSELDLKSQVLLDDISQIKQRIKLSALWEKRKISPIREIRFSKPHISYIFP